MLASLISRIRRPAIFLVTSLMFGLLIDGFVENVAAQENDPPRPPASLDLQPEPPASQDLTDQTSSGITDSYSTNEIGKPLMDMNFSIREESGRTPQDESPELFARFHWTNYPGSFQDRLAMWCAPNIRYQPLYFEDVALERYGQTRGPLIQPVASAAHFGASFSVLGLNLVRQHPGQCDYPLGFCRPGTVVPQTKTRWFWTK